MREELGVKNNICSQGASPGHRVPSSSAGSLPARADRARENRARENRAPAPCLNTAPRWAPIRGSAGTHPSVGWTLSIAARTAARASGEPLPCREQWDGVSPDRPGTPGTAERKLGLLGFQQLLAWRAGTWLGKPGRSHESEGSQAGHVPFPGLSQPRGRLAGSLCSNNGNSLFTAIAP